MDKLRQRILVIDDEQAILDLLSYNFEKEGYAVKTLSESPKSIEAIRGFKPDLVILDISMPQMDGIEVCRQIRENKAISHTLVLFLTARTEEFTEIAAFENGADDFIIKPIKPRALMKRVSVLLKRHRRSRQNVKKLSFPGIEIDQTGYIVKVLNQEIPISKREFELLYFLAANPERVYDRDALLKYVWGEEVRVMPRTVDVHIRKIREKIGEEFITTIKGVGYKFDATAVPEGLN